MEFERRAGAAGPWLLGGWLAASLLLIGSAVSARLDDFHSPGPQFYRWGLLLAAAFFVLPLAYAWLRPKALRRLDLPVLAVAAITAPLLSTPLATLTVLVLVCSILAAGRTVLDRLFPGIESRLERCTLSAGIGTALHVSVLTALGFAGILRTEALVALLLAPPVALFKGLHSCAEDLWSCVRDWGGSPAAEHPLAGFATALAVPFLGISLALALAPALAHDALMMHLPAVQHYLATHSLAPMPNLSYTYYPQGGDLLMALAACFGGQPAAQLVAPVFFAFTLAALAGVAARAGASLRARYLGAALTATLPFLIWTGSVAKNDMPMALFQALSLLCLLAAEGPACKRWLRLGVFFLAASLTVKYTAAFGAAPLGVLFLWRLRFSDHKLRELLLWAGICVALVGCWSLRAYWHTGNPVYPAQLVWAVESLRPNSMRPVEWRSIPYWKIPWTMHFDGTLAFEAPSPNPSGFFLWLFAPLWIVLRRKRAHAAETLCLVFAWIYFFYWGSVWPVLRYAIVPVALLVTLTAERLAAAWDELAPPWRPAFAATLALNGVACLLAAMFFSINAPQLALFAGKIDEPEYLRRALVTYPVLERLAQEHKPGDWTLAVGVATLAYAPGPSEFHFENLVVDADIQGQIPALLRQRRYAFLITTADSIGDQVFQALPAGVTAERVYRDANYILSRLQYQP